MGMYVIYYQDTGHVRQSTIMPQSDDESLAHEKMCADYGEHCVSAYIDQELNVHFYVSESGQAHPLTDFPTLTVTGALVSGLPSGTTVIWPDNVETIETEGAVEIASNVTGDFKFRFSHPHHFPTHTVVTLDGN